MGKAFASPRRLELIDLLAQGPRTVDELAKASKQSAANASQHLQALHGAGVVDRERDGNRVRYALAGDDVLSSGSRCETPPPSRSPRSSARRVTTSARTSRPSTATSCRTAAQRRRRPRRRPPQRGVRGRPHRRRPVRSRSTSSSSTSTSCPATPRWSPTAAVRSARMPTRRSAASDAAGRPARRLEEGWPEWHLAELEEAGAG